LRKVELAYATHFYGCPTHSSNVLLDLAPILQEQLQVLILHLWPWRAFSLLLWCCVWLLFWRSMEHCDILRRAILLLPIAVFWLLSKVSNLSLKWKTASCSIVSMNFTWIFQPICDSFCQVFWNGDVIPVTYWHIWNYARGINHRLIVLGFWSVAIDLDIETSFRLSRSAQFVDLCILHIARPIFMFPSHEMYSDSLYSFSLCSF